MTLTQLEYILAVDEHRHFATAAAHCYVTQPTLSMQIQKMEEEMGLKIFDRSRQPVIPTPLGELVLEHARRVMREVKLLEDVIKEKQGLIHGELRLGIIPTLAPYLLPIFLPSFLLVLGVMPYWDRLRRNPTIQSALIGVNACVVGILAAALYDPLWTTAIHGAADFVLAMALFVLLVFWKTPSWAIVLLGAGAGWVFSIFSL